MAYAVEGERNLVIEYQNDTNAIFKDFFKLSELAGIFFCHYRKVLNDLKTAVRDAFDYDNRVVAIYAQQDPAVAMTLEQSSEGLSTFDMAISDLEALKGKETGLLEKRQAAEETEYLGSSRVLVAGGLAAAALLLVANAFAGREMARRRRAEERQDEVIQDLQVALAEVKTVSGLIPICAWCKVRLDEGFWHCVEHYITRRTDAKVSHGMCPTCAANRAADVAKVPGSSGEPGRDV